MMDAESDLIMDYSLATRDHSHEDIAADLRKQSGYQHMDARSLQNTAFMNGCNDDVPAECANWSRFGDPKPYQCYMCDGKFPDLEGFEDHLVIHASQILFAKQDGDLSQIARKRWQQSDSSGIRSQSVHKVSSPLSRDRVGTSATHRHSDNDDDSAMNLSTHSGDVLNVKSFSCKVCGKKFAEESRLKRHIQIHSAPATYSCDVCGKSFLRPNSLRAHAICHSDARPHVCDICDRAFARAGDMRQHRATHIGLKPHACPVCGKTFARQNHVNTHLRVHSFKFKCVDCSSTFTCASELEGHQCVRIEQLHFPCEVCGVQLLSAGELEKHLQEHTGSIPYSSQCGNKSFACKQESELLKQCHTIERPYVCCECNKTFLSANKLLIHFNKHH